MILPPLQIKPDFARAYDKMAWIRATSEDTRLLNPKEAVRLAQRSCELSGYQYPIVLKTLAAAYSAAGRFGEAIETAEKALNLTLSANQQQLVDEIKEHLALYKAGQSYREKSQAPMALSYFSAAWVYSNHPHDLFFKI